jgi:hypothetical protein
MSDYIFQTIKQMDERYRQGFHHGYSVGDNERIALATMNSELRSIILELKDKYERNT